MTRVGRGQRSERALRARVRSASRVDDELLESTRHRLLRQSHVFDDPAVYAAGVEDTIAALRALPPVDEVVDATADRPSRR